jgi:replication initiation protein RepC
VIEDIREPLGLKGTSISLLRAMISFIKGDQITAAGDDSHVCFASNTALAKRTHVSIQTVERHIAKLVSLGLLTRRSSANGKRWARRDRNGRVVLATGLSLLPLSDRFAEFIQLNQIHQDNLAKLNLLRDRCVVALTKLKHFVPDRPDLETVFQTARNLLRRRVPPEALSDLLQNITQELQNLTGEKAENLRGTDPEFEGHKEPHMNRSVKKEQSSEIEVSANEMERAYPRLCAELRTARDQTECERRMGDIASQLDLGNLWFDIRLLGPAKTFMTLGYLLERIESIEKPRGYAFHLLQGLTSGTIAWRTLLTSKRAVKYR